MQSTFYHLQINIDYKNVGFYKDLFEKLGWTFIFEMEDVVGFKDANGSSLWFINAQKAEHSDFDKMGMNHVSIRVEKKEDVDEITTFLKEHSVEALFETPRHRPEFSMGEDQTYYQVMFKTEDNILFEVVYVGKK